MKETGALEPSGAESPAEPGEQGVVKDEHTDSVAPTPHVGQTEQRDQEANGIVAESSMGQPGDEEQGVENLSAQDLSTQGASTQEHVTRKNVTPEHGARTLSAREDGVEDLSTQDLGTRGTSTQECGARDNDTQEHGTSEEHDIDSLGPQEDGAESLSTQGLSARAHNTELPSIGPSVDQHGATEPRTQTNSVQGLQADEPGTEAPSISDEQRITQGSSSEGPSFKEPSVGRASIQEATVLESDIEELEAETSSIGGEQHIFQISSLEKPSEQDVSAERPGIRENSTQEPSVGRPSVHEHRIREAIMGDADEKDMTTRSGHEHVAQPTIRDSNESCEPPSSPVAQERLGDRHDILLSELQSDPSTELEQTTPEIRGSGSSETLHVDSQPPPQAELGTLEELSTDQPENSPTDDTSPENSVDENTGLDKAEQDRPLTPGTIDESQITTSPPSLTEIHAPDSLDPTSPIGQIEEESQQANELVADSSNVEQPNPQKHSVEELSAREMNAEQLGVGGPSMEVTPAQELSTQEPSTQEPGTQEPIAEQPGVGDSRTEQPAAEEPSLEEPSNESSVEQSSIQETDVEQQEADGQTLPSATVSEPPTALAIDSRSLENESPRQQDKLDNSVHEEVAQELELNKIDGASPSIEESVLDRSRSSEDLKEEDNGPSSEQLESPEHLQAIDSATEEQANNSEIAQRGLDLQQDGQEDTVSQTEPPEPSPVVESAQSSSDSANPSSDLPVAQIEEHPAPLSSAASNFDPSNDAEPTTDSPVAESREAGDAQDGSNQVESAQAVDETSESQTIDIPDDVGPESLGSSMVEEWSQIEQDAPGPSLESSDVLPADEQPCTVTDSVGGGDTPVQANFDQAGQGVDDNAEVVVVPSQASEEESVEHTLGHAQSTGDSSGPQIEAAVHDEVVTDQIVTDDQVGETAEETSSTDTSAEALEAQASATGHDQDQAEDTEDNQEASSDADRALPKTDDLDGNNPPQGDAETSSIHDVKPVDPSEEQGQDTSGQSDEDTKPDTSSEAAVDQPEGDAEAVTKQDVSISSDDPSSGQTTPRLPLATGAEAPSSNVEGQEPLEVPADQAEDRPELAKTPDSVIVQDEPQQDHTESAGQDATESAIGAPDDEPSQTQAGPGDTVAAEPVAAEPVAEEPTAEEPATAEPAAEGPIPEEAIAEEPAAEEPTAEEPTAEEPTAEEPTAEEPAIEESTAEEVVAKEATTEEAIAEEPVAPEPAAEEPATEGAILEEAITEDPAVEEPIAEEPTAEEPTAEEPTAEESTAAEVDSACEVPSPETVSKEIDQQDQVPQESSIEPVVTEIKPAESLPDGPAEEASAGDQIEAAEVAAVAVVAAAAAGVVAHELASDKDGIEDDPVVVSASTDDIQRPKTADKATGTLEESATGQDDLEVRSISSAPDSPEEVSSQQPLAESFTMVDPPSGSDQAQAASDMGEKPVLLKRVDSSTQTDELWRPKTPLPRVSTPGIVLPDPNDEESSKRSRVRSARRMSRQSVQQAEEVVAAAVIIRAAADTLGETSDRMAGHVKDLKQHGETTAPSKLQVDGRGKESPKADDKLPKSPRSREHRASHSSRSSRPSTREDGTTRSSHHRHSTHKHRADGERESDQVPRTPPRHHDTGDSAHGSHSSRSRRERTPQEQADHDRRKEERRLAREKERANADSPAAESKGKEKEVEAPPSADRSHRSSRRHSSTRHSMASPSNTARTEASTAAPSKKFFDMKNGRSEMGSSFGGPLTSDTTSTSTKDKDTISSSRRSKDVTRPPPVELKRSSTTRSSKAVRRSLDQSNAKLQKAREQESTKAAKESQPRRDESSSPAPVEGKKTKDDDKHRKSRLEKREKEDKDEKKKSSGGLKGMFKRLFSS